MLEINSSGVSSLSLLFKNSENNLFKTKYLTTNNRNLLLVKF
jgi:hypothetical protein